MKTKMESLSRPRKDLPKLPTKRVLEAIATRLEKSLGFMVVIRCHRWVRVFRPVGAETKHQSVKASETEHQAHLCSDAFPFKKHPRHSTERGLVYG